MPLTVTASASNQDKHLNEVYAVIFHDGKLYSAAVDGKIKIWKADLKLENEFQAHESAIYHIAANKNILYSCSNDGTIQSWSLDTLKNIKTLLESSEEEVLRLYVFDGKLHSGDDKGILRIWNDDKMKAQYNMVEEIRDFKLEDNFLFTVRDRDVCVTELLPGEKGKYMTRMTLEGSSPLCIVGKKLCFAARSGNVILIHENNKKSCYKQLGQLQGHEMIVNALCGFGESTLYSGGYDGKIKQWDLETMQCVSTCEVGYCINSICVGNQGQIYSAGDNGFINKIENK